MHPKGGDVIGCPTPLIPRKLDPRKSWSSEKEEEETTLKPVKAVTIRDKRLLIALKTSHRPCACLL